nr:MAG: nonstructural protein [Microvirus sp.]
MKLLACAVRDGAVGAFLTPMFFRSKGEAIRSFTDAATNSEHQFSKHMSDYVFYVVGEFDDNSGLFSPCEPLRLISALECSAPDPRSPPPGHVAE